VASCDAIQWGFFDLECTVNISGVPQNLMNSYKWQNAIDEDNPNKRVALGHVLHLLADMAVPDHTRNDPHPESLPPYSPSTVFVFEQYAKAHISERNIPTSGNLVTFNRPEGFLTDLSNFARSRFFSKDTVFDSPYPSYHEDPNYFFDSEGLRIAHKSFLYRYVTHNLHDCTLDDNVFHDQFNTLYPKAVLYTASLIKHYYDLTHPQFGWLSFVEGNPGVPGDGVFVSADGGNNWAGFELAVPISLGTFTDGFTGTIFLPSYIKDLYIAYGITAPQSCNISDIKTWTGHYATKILFNGIEGFSDNMSGFQHLLDAANYVKPGCCPTVNDLFISMIYIDLPDLTPFTTLDAATILPGQNAVP
jgi:hypothetical protein